MVIYCKILANVHLKMAIRMYSSYRIKSDEMVWVTCDITLVDLIAHKRRITYEKNEDDEDIEQSKRSWENRRKLRRQNATKGTEKLIPNIKSWVERDHEEVNYYFTQALSAHNFFKFIRGLSENQKQVSVGFSLTEKAY